MRLNAKRFALRKVGATVSLTSQPMKAQRLVDDAIYDLPACLSDPAQRESPDPKLAVANQQRKKLTFQFVRARMESPQSIQNAPFRENNVPHVMTVLLVKPVTRYENNIYISITN